MINEQSGGVYCKHCSKCICPPRKRKNWHKESFILCEECQDDSVHIVFRPREESLETDFFVKHEDIPVLIQSLATAYRSHGGGPIVGEKIDY